jgi:PAS domain S-box-containing protein
VTGPVNSSAKILIVDDDPGVLKTLADVLRRKDYTVATTMRGEDALALSRAEQLHGRPFDAAIVDINLPGLSGLQILESAKAISPDTEIIVITAYASLDTAIEAIDRDAFAYLVKPFDMDQLLAGLDRALETRARREAERRRTRQALQESEDRYRTLVETARDVIFTMSPDGTFTSLNPVFEELLGWPREEWIGKPFAALIHPDDLSRFMELFQAFLRQERLPAQEVRVLTKSGEYRIGEITAALRVQGANAWVLGIARDITERRRAEAALRASEERYRALFENANDIVFTVDLAGNFTAVNRAAEVLTGYRRDQTSRLNFAQVVAPEQVKLAREMLGRKVAGGGASTYELEIIARDGHRIPLEISTRPIVQDGQLVGVQGVARDITERNQAREALRRLNEIQEEVAKRIAHALHDEAGQVLASVYLAVADVARGLPTPARDKLRGIWQLLDQVDLQLRRLSHELRPTILDDLGLIPALEFLAEGVAKRTQLRITVQGSTGRLPPLIETALYRSVQEALTNVTRHAQARSVDVRIQREDQVVRCSVKDDGIGFEVQPVLSRRGERGLGLMGIRERLSALGGALEINSAPGQGTELAIALRLEA